MKGLFSSIYGATDEGIFDILFSRHGASPPVKRTDIRLGDYGQDESEEEDDEEEEEVAAPAPTPMPAASAPVMAAPSMGRPSGGFFSQDIGGFPLWLVGVGFLGFAWAIRRERKKQTSKKSKRRRR